MADAKIVAATVGMLADQAAKNIAAKLNVDLVIVTAAIAEEVNRIEAQLSVLLSHLEGHYRSELAKTKGFFGRLFRRSK
jgi:hypothetical protein